ncbi:MAG: LysR family transcriptional regulator [Burkholderiaceae bacterium]|jgi:molybdate transport system regulatory protein|nr:LysR family transcriptional regulator [Burkholderiaceae bacterium]
MNAESPPSLYDLVPALGHDLADRRMAILRHIAAGHSISQAAREAGISYKAAWQALDVLTNLAGRALVERTVGGAGGGGARITEAGLSLLAMADALEDARAQVLRRFAERDAQSLAPAARLGLRISMRNLWPCRIESLQAQGAQVRAWLLPDGSGADGVRIAARITQESVQLLALAPGVPVMALCKATAVQVLASAPADGENRWPATVQRLARGGVEAAREVVARLPWGGSGVGYAMSGEGLRAGRKVWLQVPESSVVLAIAG